MAQSLLEAIVVAVGGRIASRCGQQARLVREGLLPVRAEILDDGGLDTRGLSGLQHAGDADRHAAERGEMRDLAADALGETLAGFWTGATHQLLQYREGF